MLDLIDSYKSNYLILKRIHILFEPSIEIDPLKLLAGLAKHKALIVFWPGIVSQRDSIFLIQEK